MSDEIIVQMREESHRLGIEIDRLRRLRAVYDNAIRGLDGSSVRKRGRPSVEDEVKREVVAVFAAAPSGFGIEALRARWPDKSERTLRRWLTEGRRLGASSRH